MEMPAKKTTYWCTVQKSPPLPTKHHIVGVRLSSFISKILQFSNANNSQFRPILDTAGALKHTHHFIVHKCRAPADSTDEETFERFIGQPGGECYVGSRDVPMSYCESYLFLWAVGGKVTA